MSIAQASDVQTWLNMPALTPVATLAWQLAEQHVKDYLGWQEVEQFSYVEYYPREPESQRWYGDNDIYELSGDMKRAVPLYSTSPNIIQLQQIPVRSVTELRADPMGFFGQYPGAFPDNTILTPGIDYYVKYEQPNPYGTEQQISWCGQIVRRSSLFPIDPGSLMVTYLAGFTAAELAGTVANGRWSVFKTAVLETAADLYLRAMAVANGQWPGISDEDLGGARTKYVQENLKGVEVPDPVAAKLQKYVSMASAAY